MLSLDSLLLFHKRLYGGALAPTGLSFLSFVFIRGSKGRPAPPRRRKGKGRRKEKQEGNGSLQHQILPPYHLSFYLLSLQFRYSLKSPLHKKKEKNKLPYRKEGQQYKKRKKKKEREEISIHSQTKGMTIRAYNITGLIYSNRSTLVLKQKVNEKYIYFYYQNVARQSKEERKRNIRFLFLKARGFHRHLEEGLSFALKSD